MPSGKNPAETFERLAGEVRLLFHELKAVAEAIDDDPDGLTASHRGVLESLTRGPSAVPALARERPVSRQHIQTLVNRLLELNLVVALANPAHERSPLITLTPAGAKRFKTMHRRERRALGRAKFPVSEARMGEVTETLRRLREFLASMGSSRYAIQRDEADRAAASRFR